MRINRLVKSGILTAIKENDYPLCESCIYRKMAKLPFPSKAHRGEKILDLVHSYIYGSISVPTQNNYFYFITFIDDYSR